MDVSRTHLLIRRHHETNADGSKELPRRGQGVEDHHGSHDEGPHGPRGHRLPWPAEDIEVQQCTPGRYPARTQRLSGKEETVLPQVCFTIL